MLVKNKNKKPTNIDTGLTEARGQCRPIEINNKPPKKDKKDPGPPLTIDTLVADNKNTPGHDTQARLRQGNKLSTGTHPILQMTEGNTT